MKNVKDNEVNGIKNTTKVNETIKVFTHSSPNRKSYRCHKGQIYCNEKGVGKGAVKMATLLGVSEYVVQHRNLTA